jgi:predicted MFS family arabinose efflux permease
MLIGSRVLQGAMAATMIPQILSIIQANFLPGERATAFAAYGTAAGLANVSGPLVAGLLIQADLFGLGWRSIFLINLPVGVALLIAAAMLVRESEAPIALRLDPVGVAIVSVGLLLVLYPLLQGRELGWPAWSFVALTTAVPVLTIFVLWERRKTRRDGSPLVSLGLFRQRAFVAGLAVTLIVVAGISSFFLVYVLYAQIGLGFSTLTAALFAMPWPIGIALAAGISGRHAAAGRHLLTVGSLLVALGLAALAWTIRHYGPEITGWHLMPALAVGGLGIGLVFPPLTDITLAGVQPRDAGSASGVVSTAQQFGGAAGVAVIGVIFFGLLASEATTSVDAVTPQIRNGLAAAGLPPATTQQVVADFRDCFVDRSIQPDPTVIPPSCRANQPGTVDASTAAHKKIGRVVEAAAADAVRLNFSRAAEQTIWWQAGAFLVAFLLAFLLPHKVLSHQP